MFIHQSFLSLTGFSPQLLVLFLGKREKRYITDRDGVEALQCINCDNLTMPYKELENTYKITRPRIIRAIDELLSKGFLELRHHGGAYLQDKSVYALSNKWLIWRPGIVFNARPKGVRRGYQGNKK